MLLESVRNWFAGDRGSPPRAPATVAPATVAPATVAPATVAHVSHPKPLPPRQPAAAARAAITDALWGEGFDLPGGADEILLLVKPLALTPAVSLMVLGAGGGGPAHAVARALGVWVGGFEADPERAASAMALGARAGLGRRAGVQVWDPERPELGARAFHHALALLPFRGAAAEPVLAACARALRPGGQLALIELVAGAGYDAADHAVAAWARTEGRDAARLPGRAAIAAGLAGQGFDVRVADDISDRHARLALSGWLELVQAMRTAAPDPVRAAALVAEAERWLRRLHLLRDGRLRLIRWHAIWPGPRPPG